MYARCLILLGTLLVPLGANAFEWVKAANGKLFRHYPPSLYIDAETTKKWMCEDTCRQILIDESGEFYVLVNGKKRTLKAPGIQKNILAQPEYRNGSSIYRTKALNRFKQLHPNWFNGWGEYKRTPATSTGNSTRNRLSLSKEYFAKKLDYVDPVFCKITRIAESSQKVSYECKTVGQVTLLFENKSSADEIRNYQSRGLISGYTDTYRFLTPGGEFTLDLKNYLPPYFTMAGQARYFGGTDPASGRLQTKLVEIPVLCNSEARKRGENCFSAKLYLKIGQTPDETCIVSAFRTGVPKNALLNAGYLACEMEGNWSPRVRDAARGVENGVALLDRRVTLLRALNNPPSCANVNYDSIREQARRIRPFPTAKAAQKRSDRYFDFGTHCGVNRRGYIGRRTSH